MFGVGAFALALLSTFALDAVGRLAATCDLGLDRPGRGARAGVEVLFSGRVSVKVAPDMEIALADGLSKVSHIKSIDFIDYNNYAESAIGPRRMPGENCENPTQQMGAGKWWMTSNGGR